MNCSAFFQIFFSVAVVFTKPYYSAFKGGLLADNQHYGLTVNVKQAFNTGVENI